MIKGGTTNATQVTEFTGLAVQTSAQGLPIPIIYGKSKRSVNLIWDGDFQAIPVKQGKGGGKGLGGGKGASASYDYKAAVMLALGEGPFLGIDRVWADGKLTTLSALGLTLFLGTAAQAPWPFLVSNHPTEALAYAYTAYLAAEAYDLGMANVLPNLTFEVIGKLSGTMPGTVDANFADAISDLVTNPQYGLGPLDLDATSLAFFGTYQRAQGLFFSPAVDSARPIHQIINDWMELGNSWCFWSGGSAKFCPLGDVPITANGVTYTPDLTIRYALTSKDFLCSPGQTPIEVDQTDPADAPNHLKLEVYDRENEYNVANVEWQDPALVAQFGRVDANVSDAHPICDLVVGNIVKMLVGQRKAYIRNTYHFSLGFTFTLLEPGDLVTIVDPKSGIPLPRTVRITSMDENDKDEWEVQAEDFLNGVGSAIATEEVSAAGNSVDLLVAPGDINPPGVFEPRSDLTGGVAQIWIAASGGENWGGAFVMLSFDGLDYVSIGVLAAPAWQGLLTAPLANHVDPDTTNTLSVDLAISASVMSTSVTHADADAKRTLAFITAPFTTVCPVLGELIAYGTVVQGMTTNAFDLTYLRRGLYGSAPAAHSSGDFFSRFDLNSVGSFTSPVLVYDLPISYIGQTIYLKFLSVNRYGNSAQTLADVVEYTYTTQGTGFGSGSGGKPGQPSGFAATPMTTSVLLNWSANPSTDNVTFWEVWGAVGTSVAFGSTAKMATTNGLNFTISNLLPSTNYTFYLVADNEVGSSVPSTVLNTTTLAVNPSVTVTVNATPFTLPASTSAVTYYDIVNTTGAPIVLKMPASPTDGQLAVLTDVNGTAGTNSMTIKDNAGVVTIDTMMINNQWSKLRWRTSASAWAQTG